MKQVTSLDYLTTQNAVLINWAGENPANDGRGQTTWYMLDNFEDKIVDRAVAALKTVYAAEKLAMQLIEIDINLGRSWVAEKSKALDLLIDAGVVVLKPTDFQAVRSARQLQTQIRSAVGLLGQVVNKIVSSRKEEPKVLMTMTKQLDAADYSVAELITLLSSGEKVQLIRMTDRTARNMLDLAARKLRKGDTTAKWATIVKAVAPFINEEA